MVSVAPNVFLKSFIYRFTPSVTILTSNWFLLISFLFQKNMLLIGKGPYVIALTLGVNEKTKTVSVLSSGNTFLGSALPVNSTYL